MRLFDLFWGASNIASLRRCDVPVSLPGANCCDDQGDFAEWVSVRIVGQIVAAVPQIMGGGSQLSGGLAAVKLSGVFALVAGVFRRL